MSNMELWERLRAVPDSAKKKITGGRLSGMTDIKPQWRYEMLTAEFGPCGIGWYYNIEELWLTPGADGEQVAWAKVELFVVVDGKESQAIPGIGGSMLIANERNGPHTSDEAYKMAVTDAIGTAAKMIGLAADVYMGLADSKYSREKAPNVNPKPLKPSGAWVEPTEKLAGRIPADDSPEPAPATGPQVTAIKAMVSEVAGNNSIVGVDLQEFAKKMLKVSSIKDLTSQRASGIIEKDQIFKDTLLKKFMEEG